jgi:TM2 domain-containing membrane protein YozV/ribosomal protein L37E
MDTSSPGDASRERAPDEVFCRNCGEAIHEQAEICPHCGVRNRDPPKSSVDSLLDDLTGGGNPFVAALASVLVPGLGQLYNREPKKALVVFVASIVAAFSFLALVGFVLYPAVWLYAIYDAYTVADRQSAEG